MASEFHYGYVFLVLTAACASATDKTPVDAIDLPAASAKHDGKLQNLNYSRHGAPEDINVKEQILNSTDNRYYRPVDNPRVGPNGGNTSAPGDTNPRAAQNAWGWSTNSSSSSPDLTLPPDPLKKTKE